MDAQQRVPTGDRDVDHGLRENAISVKQSQCFYEGVCVDMIGGQLVASLEFQKPIGFVGGSTTFASLSGQRF
jgi:hypothetical protein